MSLTPMFIATPQSDGVGFSTANANRDGTGTIATLATAGANGRRIEAIKS